MLQLEILPVTENNWRAIASLKVADHQRDFIESNCQSLLEAAYDRSLAWRPLALYDDDTPVGFAMIGAWDPATHSVWLDRFMLGQRFQGAGRGGAFLERLITFLFAEYPATTILLSLHETNTAAAALYRRHGFRDSGRYDPENGEKIFLLSKDLQAAPRTQV